MKALLFPGQGSQVIGMGSEFFKNFSLVKKLFSEADERIGYKISKIILEGPEADLKLTENTQPAILTVSYAIFSVLKKEFNFDFNEFKFFAGHSLGEYSALVSANALSFSDAVYLLNERGKAMQQAVPVGQGGMIAALGIDLDELNNFILQLKKKGVCEIANDNAEGQIIVSGNTEIITELQSLLKLNKKKAIILPVSAPFHCSLMKDAAIKMKSKISSTKFKKSDFEIIANVTAKPEDDVEKIKTLLVEQIYSKVRWRESIIFMINNGIKEFIEIGPGKVLNGLVKRINRDVNSTSINTIDDIKKLINES